MRPAWDLYEHGTPAGAEQTGQRSTQDSLSSRRSSEHDRDDAGVAVLRNAVTRALRGSTQLAPDEMPPALAIVERISSVLACRHSHFPPGNPWNAYADFALL